MVLTMSIIFPAYVVDHFLSTDAQVADIDSVLAADI